MKLFNLILFAFGFSFILGSCSNDDTQEPLIEEKYEPQIGLFGINDGSPSVELPQAMVESSDPHAIMATAYVNISTSFSIYGAFFDIPDGATASNDPITAKNGRVSNDYIVYEWIGADGSAIAYQFSQQGDKELFEIFLKEGSKGYLKFIEILQNKGGKAGTMKWFSELGMSATWTWEIIEEESYLIFSSDDSKYEVKSNKDLSGSVKFYTSNSLVSEISWDREGNGIWKDFDESGEIVEEGEWEV